MLDYPSLSAVAAVVREGSFERAASALGITPSAVSQRVRGLEERVGAVLVVRGQPCTATDLGRTLCAHLDRVRLLEHDLPTLGGALGPAEGRLTLPVAVNADSLATWFPAAAAAFGREGEAALDLALDDEAHTAARLRSGEVLAAVTAEREPVPGCRTVPLGALRYAACAASDFITRHFPTGVTPEALRRAPFLRFDRRDFLQSRWAGTAHGVEPAGAVHWVPSTHGFLDMTLAGLAWGMHPVAMAQPHLDAGRLVELPPGQRVEVPLYWTVARLHASLLSRLTKAVRAAAARVLVPPA
ncbi:LysR family transcriptional regulator ArgP [Starkeya koreensis]|uniref:LysR family transcriptional regulator ArgP n=1 Tax=Ancylobacter koreensis TaxID=266121 RepID=A0ABT0DHU6_9HYPH|nr:LysR family transcriptional regulator ArgP [Ancylobacter koreensis]MCK0206657.1 LysR family transcriptional regulator ArgP [Ancylobacter koreensis]